MLRSMARKLEIELFYGQSGIAVIDSSYVSGTTYPIQASEWAPGVWAGAENMPIDVYNGSSLVGSANVTAVDMTAQTVTVDVDPGAASGYTLYVKGSFGNEFAGIYKILTNTGTLFNISAGTYALWKGNTYSAGSAALSLTKIEQAVARAVEKGLDADVVVLVNPRGWANLLSDQAALRKYDSSYKPGEMANGAEAIKFYGQNGTIEIQPSIFVKQGYAFVLCKDDWIRVGSTDVTFKRPGQGEEFFRDLDSAAGYELRAFTDQAIFCSAPGRQVLINNIVNQ